MLKNSQRAVNSSNKNVNNTLFELPLPIYFFIIRTGRFTPTFCELFCCSFFPTLFLTSNIVMTTEFSSLLLIIPYYSAEVLRPDQGMPVYWLTLDYL